MSDPHYGFDYVSVASGAVVPANLETPTYWYDSGETDQSQNKIYYDADKNYNIFAYNNEWWIAAFGTLAPPPAMTDSFIKTGLSSITGSYTGFEGWSGTLVLDEPVIGDAWYRAETAAFDSLVSFTGSTENDNCFRGFLPIMGDGTDLKYVNVWQMTSGGSGTFDMERLSGESGNWCSLRTDLRIDSIWKSRQEAMEFSGAVLAWLRSTGNMAQIENVTWCFLSEIPSEPEEYLTDGRNRQRYWRQAVDLELVYATEAEY